MTRAPDYTNLKGPLEYLFCTFSFIVYKQSKTVPP